MAIARTQAVSATANNVAISSTTVGDLIVVFAYGAGSATIPSLAAGFTSASTTSGTGQAQRTGYKVSTGGETSSGTWTNATAVVCLVFSGASGLAVSPVVNSGNTATLGFAALALSITNGSSVFVGFGGATSATAGMGGTPSGGTVFLTNRTNQTTVCGCDTAATASNYTIQTLAVTGTGRWATVVAEVLASVFTKALTATLSPTATLNKKISQGGFVANLVSTAQLNKLIRQGGFAAGLSFVGNLATNLIHAGGTLFFQSFTASLALTGLLTRRTSKALSATLTLIGNQDSGGQIARRTGKSFTATLFSGASGFNPLTIAGCKLWLKADALGLSDGTPVGTWTDSSGSGNDFTQATTGNKPLYKTGIINGLPTVLFDGSDDFMAAASAIDSGSTRSVFVVLQPTLSTASQKSYATFIHNTGGFGCFLVAHLSTNAWGTFVSPSTDVSSGNALTSGTRYLLENTAATNSIFLYQNGVQVAFFVGQEVGSGGAPGLGKDLQNANREFAGHIAEVLWYDTVLSSGNRALVENYLMSKYGIGGAGSWATLTKQTGKVFNAILNFGQGIDTTNLISFWKMDEASGTRNDSVGINHLTSNNSVAGVTGKLGLAAQFVRASSRWLNCASNASLVTGDIDFTIAGWFQLASKPAIMTLVTKGDASNGEFALQYITGADQFRFVVWGGLGYSNAGLINATSFGSPPLNTWIFVVAWHDAVAHTVNIQINNGTVDSASDATGHVITTTADFMFSSPVSSQYWDGLADEWWFFKRKLSASERTSLYNSGVGVTYPFPGGGGTLTKRVGKSLTATLSFVGTLTRLLRKNLTATLSFVGTLLRGTLFFKAFTATLSFVGNLATSLIHGGTVFTKNLVATLTFSGNLRKLPMKNFVATLVFSGDLRRTFVKIFLATLVFSASLTRRTSKVFNATLSFVGLLVVNFLGILWQYYINLRPGQFKPTESTLAGSETESTLNYTTTESGDFKNVKTNDNS